MRVDEFVVTNTAASNDCLFDCTVGGVRLFKFLFALFYTPLTYLGDWIIREYEEYPAGYGLHEEV